MLPQLNMRRVYLIARRDFFGYIKTWGFWLSFLMPFIFATIGFFASTMNISVEPVRYETILDETGLYSENIKEYDELQSVLNSFSRARFVLKRTGLAEETIDELEELYVNKDFGRLRELAPSIDFEGYQKTIAKKNYVDPPSQDVSILKDYLIGNKTLEVEDGNVSISSLLHIYEGSEGLQVDYWSDNVNNSRLRDIATSYFQEEARNRFLETGGLDKNGLKAALNKAPNVKAFDPGKTAVDGNQEVTLIDMIPTGVSLVASVFLWLTIFSGAYMLLTSMLEEKLNKLLEMMLSTTRLSEIMFGKLIGVAALTITAMLPYLVMSLGGAIFAAVFIDPDIAAPLAAAFTPKLIIFFFVFLILGYLFYGALFIALGSLAESMQDAQTLTTPIMLILTACVMVVPLSYTSPDSPLLTFAAWFPLSAPFAGMARLHLDPPWWELILQSFFLFLSSLVVIWLAGRIFRFGVFSGAGVKGVTQWFKRAVLRRKA